MKVEVQRPYIHYKGKLYYVHHIVQHTETEEVFVSYQSLYPPYGMHVRPYAMFIETIDQNKPDNVTKQTQRFVLYEGDLFEK
ncbi:MAG: DUF1653 domain-containing protein [Culicoidibacterales bacterium]